MPLTKPFNRYLAIEPPDTAATIDFLGNERPLTVHLTLDGDELHVRVISATYDSPILIDEVVTVPEGDGNIE